jgi:hypothetical protein
MLTVMVAGGAHPLTFVEMLKSRPFATARPNALETVPENAPHIATQSVSSNPSESRVMLLTVQPEPKRIVPEVWP